MTPDQVMDTPAGLLDKMMTLENIYNVFQEVESIPPGGMADWANANPQKWGIVIRVNGWV